MMGWVLQRFVYPFLYSLGFGYCVHCFGSLLIIAELVPGTEAPLQFGIGLSLLVFVHLLWMKVVRTENLIL